MILIILSFFITLTTQSIIPNHYIIQLDALCEINGGDPQSLIDTNNALDDCLNSSNISTTTKYHYTKVFAGRSITSDTNTSYLLSSCPQIKKIWPSRNIMAPFAIPGGPIKPIFEFANNMTGVAWSKQEMNLTGAGIKVGIIDTGIDYTHPAFGACIKIGDSGCRVQFGYDFVGDGFTGDGSAGKPDNDPMDSCNGHGTHVAGIVAANDADHGVFGVAQNAVLGIYRIFGCTGGTSTDVVLAAMRRAYEDGMDIINMSLGADDIHAAIYSAGFADSPESLVVEDLAKKGMIISVAIGNVGGSQGVWYAANPAVADSATAVASFDSSNGVRRTFTFGSDTKPIVFAYNLMPITPPDPQIYDVSLVTDLVQTQSGYEPTQGCSTLNSNIQGKIVLLNRGGSCTFMDKAITMNQAGAIAVIFSNNRPGDMGPLAPLSGIPIFTISQDDGIYLANLLSQNNTANNLTFSNTDILVDLPMGANVSSFSTWGLGPNMDIKPDFGAPGSYIYSTFPVKLGSYKVLSGTSMSTPYISACYALYLEYLHRVHLPASQYQFDPVSLRGMLANYASAIDRHSDPTTDYVLSVQKQGAGLIQLDKTIQAKSFATPSKILLGTILEQTTTQVTIYNYDTMPKQYLIRLDRSASMDVTDATAPFSLNSSTSVYFSTNLTTYTESINVLVEPGSPSTFYCEFHLDTNPSIKQNSQIIISGFIEITPTSKQDQGFVSLSTDFVFSIPYAGMQGYYEQQAPLDMTVSPPSIGWSRIKNSQKSILFGSFSRDGLHVNDLDLATDSLIIQWRQRIPLESITFYLVDTTGYVLGTIMTQTQVCRNSNNPNDAAFVTQWVWNASYTDPNGVLAYLEEGDYYVLFQYTLVEYVGGSGSLNQTVYFPLVSLSWSDSGKQVYLNQTAH